MVDSGLVFNTTLGTPIEPSTSAAASTATSLLQTSGASDSTI
ncbi:hypothetical protein ABMA10_07210 [Plantibacter sp. RU18]